MKEVKNNIVKFKPKKEFNSTVKYRRYRRNGRVVHQGTSGPKAFCLRKKKNGIDFEFIDHNKKKVNFTPKIFITFSLFDCD